MGTEQKLYKRSDKKNYMKVESKYEKMTGFTEGGKSYNAKTYDRQYIDEDFERSDVTGYATEISYAFDRYTNNKVHDKLAKIHEEELTGESVEIVTVNFKDEVADSQGKKFYCNVRSFSVIPDAEGDSTDAYTYSGAFKAGGAGKKMVATTTDNWATIAVEEVH